MTLYEAHREWLLEELAKDYDGYRESRLQGDSHFLLAGRIDARLLDGLQFDLIDHDQEAYLRRLYLVDEPMTPEELDG